MSVSDISVAASAAMNARALFAIIYIAFSNCVTIQNNELEPDIEAHIKEELAPLFIVCNLSDIVTITVPENHSNIDALYYLYNPNNDVRKLDIKHENLAVERTNGNKTVEYNRYNVTNVNLGKKVDSITNDSFGGDEKFVIGPVGEEDHGNWVLSIYYKRNGSWVEEFQVITIQIVEYVPIQLRSTLTEGDTLELGFAYPLPDVATCELVQPSTNRTYDRYFREFELLSLHTCTYIIRNLSIQDSAVWTIIGVGNIVYEGRGAVEVKRIENLRSRTEVRNGDHSTFTLVNSSYANKYLNFNIILPVGLILKIYCL